jgi:hypothetical protein
VRVVLRSLRTLDLLHLLLLAIPCSTFSRARDRSGATCLRSSARPWGLEGLTEAQQAIVNEANTIARQAWDLAVWAAKELKAVVMIENPKTSYLWEFLASIHPSSSPQPWCDYIVSQCRFGTAYRKASGDIIGLGSCGSCMRV